MFGCKAKGLLVSGCAAWLDVRWINRVDRDQTGMLAWRRWTSKGEAGGEIAKFDGGGEQRGEIRWKIANFDVGWENDAKFDGAENAREEE